MHALRCSSTNRSRRKSCQSCADSKVKCDLGRPCSKCKARGRECVYLYGHGAGSCPEETTSAQNAASTSSPESGTTSQTLPSTQQDASPDAAISLDGSSSSPSTLSNLTTSPDLLNGTSPASSFSLPAGVLDANATLGAFNPSSLISVPTAGSPSSGEKAYFTELVESEMYDNLFSDVFTSSFQKNPTVPGHHFNIDPTSILTYRLESTGIDQAIIDQVFGTHTASLAMYPNLSDPVFPSDPLESIPEQEIVEPPLPPPPVEQTVQVLQPEMPSVAEYYEFGKPLCPPPAGVNAYVAFQLWHSSRHMRGICLSSTCRHSFPSLDTLLWLKRRKRVARCIQTRSARQILSTESLLRYGTSSSLIW